MPFSVVESGLEWSGLDRGQPRLEGPHVGRTDASVVAANWSAFCGCRFESWRCDIGKGRSALKRLGPRPHDERMEAATGRAMFSAVELDRDECVRLLGQAPIGRVVLNMKCLPVALPVNICVLNDAVVFATDQGSKLDAAVTGQVVSVEVDDIDTCYRTGWSVIVTGVADLVSDRQQFEEARAWLHSWAPGPHPFFVRVPTTLNSGRRLLWTSNDAG
jgi:hypothetical protein